MHPTALDVEYMRKVIARVGDFTVHSFEVCAECHSNMGGLDGLADYQAYPEAAKALDQAAVRENQARMREIIALAHSVNKPLVYWHREAMVPEGLLTALPELLDDCGEFNLLGKAYEELLRYKIAAAFEAVPELDGLVLTLTEATFSVIHSASPEKYPPVKVVEHIVRIFAGELQKRNKRFVLRSFGSIAQDYQDILAGAAAAARDFEFEIETKITPYDFDPFLPVNEFLRKVPGTRLGAECDSLGEFLGSGMLPAENVENIVQYVRSGRAAGVDRYIIRMDRIGNSIFDRYMLNIYAYERAIANENITAAEIVDEYLEKTAPAECHQLFRQLAVDGLEVIKKINFIDGNVISHQTPPQSLKYLKAGFIFAVFKNGVSLENGSGVWSILNQQRTPGRAEILSEKAAAVNLTEKNSALLQALHEKLGDHPEILWRKELWGNARIAARTFYLFSDCVCKYFDDIEAANYAGNNFFAAVERAQLELTEMAGGELQAVSKDHSFVNGLDQALFKACSQVREFYPAAWYNVIELLKKEFITESSMRQKYAADAFDCILCGSITDEWRIWRYMHAAHASENNGENFRFAGNSVFPNGKLKMTLQIPQNSGVLEIHGDTAVGAPEFAAEFNGKAFTLNFDSEGKAVLPIEEAGSQLALTLHKSSGTALFPAFRAVRVLKNH